MKTPRVYVDTSVIGGCFDPEFSTWSLGLMVDFKLGLLRPVVSEIVRLEIAGAPSVVRQQYDTLLSYGAEEVVTDEEVAHLAAAYAAQQILPVKYVNDARHIALATVAEVDVLVSWNFRHIVHFDKIRLFNAVNQLKGYRPVAIYSPREVTIHGKEL